MTKITRDESRAAMLALRETLAPALSLITGETWTTPPLAEDAFPGDGARWFKVERATGPALSIGARHDEGKIHVSCDCVTDVNGRRIFWHDVAPWNGETCTREPAPEMNASLSKPAGTIARDIARRILPAVNCAVPWFQEALKRAEEAANQYDAACAMMERLGANLPPVDRRDREREMSAYLTPASGGTLRVVIRSYGTLTVEVGLKPDAKGESLLRAILAAS